MKFLVMVRHFAPSTRAVGVTTRRACLALPKGTCVVLTADRSFDPGGLFDEDFQPDLPVERVRARLSNLLPRHPLPHNLDYLEAMVTAARKLHRRYRFDGLLVHYPDRFTLLAGLLVGEVLRLPMVIHMHDYFSEALIAVYPLRVWWWRQVECRALERAALIVVPTPRFAERYRQRGYRRLFVLPHLTAPRVPAPRVRDNAHPLEIVFTGSVYEATEQSVRALVETVRGRGDVRLRFATPSRLRFLEGVSVGPVSRRECLKMQEEADVLFLPLGIDNPYPLEIQSCLPSKLLDYLAAGKPVLAIVPPGCYVAELVERYGFGELVTTVEGEAISRAVDRLRSADLRRVYGERALAACADFSPELHGPRFARALAAACRLDPPSTESEGARL